MVSHYRIKTAEFDTPFEMWKSFVFSLIFHIITIGTLLFSPEIFSEKKRTYFTAYKVTLVELPKREKAVQKPIQEPPAIPSELVIIPHPPVVIEEAVKSPEPVITKPEETKTPPIKMKQKDPKQKSEKKEKQMVKKKKEAEPIPAQGKTKETAKKPEEAYALATTQLQPLIKKTDETIAAFSPPVGDISLDTKEFPYEWYLIGIKNKIESRWSTLDVELLSGEIKKVIIKFKILRNGRIEKAEIEKSSGLPLFDNSALRAVLSSEPLPPLPRSFIEDSLVIHFGFEHKKNG